MRDIALANLFWLYTRRIYFHDIKHYKKLLAYIREDNIKLIKDWLTSERTLSQGCCQAIKFVRRFPLTGSRSPLEELQIKAAVIGWLDNASGREAKKPWVDKLSFIQQAVAQKDLDSICQWILHNKRFRIDKDGLGDDVFKRFYKSATWYFQRTR